VSSTSTLEEAADVHLQELKRRRRRTEVPARKRRKKEHRRGTTYANSWWKKPTPTSRARSGPRSRSAFGPGNDVDVSNIGR
jgi:hypothetical protein